MDDLEMCKFCRLREECAMQVPGPYRPPCAAQPAEPSAAPNNNESVPTDVLTKDDWPLKRESSLLDRYLPDETPPQTPTVPWCCAGTSLLAVTVHMGSAVSVRLHRVGCHETSNADVRDQESFRL